MKNLKILVGILLFALPASAHPVAYRGAWGLMGYHQPDMVDWQVTYTPHPRFAVGVDYYRDAMDPITRSYYIPRVNFLLNRWNGKDYQANIYVSGGYGLSEAGGSTNGALFAAGEADYETRKIYFSGRASGLFSKGLADSTYYQLRAGFAPYVAESGALHSWFILQAQYFPSATTDKTRFGPVLRFFYQNVLWEVGSTAQGMWNFNFMIHF